MEAEATPGLWLVDKPAGPTSHDVVAGVRRRLGGRKVKVGHAGTLDPFATGLLVVLVGRATRLAPYLSGLDKSYLATVRLGATSATGDPEGPVLETGEPPARERVEAVLPVFLGRQRQRVPAMSAVKVDGERLYRRVRRGEEVEPPEREIVIHELALVDDPDGAGRTRSRSRSGAARAPTCASSPSTWASGSAAAATATRCGGRRWAACRSRTRWRPSRSPGAGASGCWRGSRTCRRGR